MANWDAGVGAANGSYIIRLNASENTNYAGNYSTVSWSLELIKTGGGYAYSLDNRSYWYVYVGGYAYDGYTNYDFRNTSSKTLASGTTGAIGHAANGSLTISVRGYFSGADAYPLSSGDTGWPSWGLTDFVYTPGAPGAPGLYRDSAGTSLNITSQVPSSPITLEDYQWAYSTDGSNYSGWIDFGGGATRQAWTGVGKTTNYWIITRAYNADGWGGNSSASYTSGFPSSPTGLSVTPSTTVSGRVDLSWSTPGTTNGGITGYSVFRDGTLIANTSGTGTTYSNTGLTPGNTHSYYVVARNSAADAVGGYSDGSNTVSGVVVPGVPGAPTGLTATPGTNSTDTGKIYLSWTAPSFQNPSITGYDVYRNGIKVVTLNGTGTTYTDTGLTPGSLYSYKVQARNTFADTSGLRSPDSNVTASTMAPGVPSIPRNFTATPDATLAGKINLAWAAPTSTNGAITGYDIYRKLSIDAAWPSTPTTIINGSTTLAQSYVDLPEGATYNFKIVARNSYADSSGLRSAEATASAMSPGLPDAPTSLAGSSDSTVAGKVVLSWVQPANPDGAITGYNIYVKAATEPTFPSTPVLKTYGTLTSYAIEGQSGLPGVPVLVVGDVYDFKITARNAFADSSGGQSPYSNIMSIMSPGLPSAPTLLSAIASTSAYGKVTLTWEKPTNVAGGIIDYYLYADGLLQTSVAGENTTTGSISGLNPRQEYTFTVAARNIWATTNAVAGPQSNGIKRTTSGPPSAPRNLQGAINAITAGSIDLSWLAPLDVSGGITGYSIYFSDGTLIAETYSAVTSYTVAGLTPAIQYSFYVKARNAISDLPGMADSSPSNTFTLTARGEPDAPGNVVINSTSAVSGRLTLSWTPPSVGGTIVGYNVFLANGTKLGTTSSTTFVVDGLTGGQTYSFYVKARNSVTDAAGTPGGTSSAVTTGTPSSTSLQTLPTPVTVLNETNTTLGGSATITAITSTSFSYVKTASNIVQSVVPAGSGSVVNNTNTTINGTYIATSTPDVSRVTYSRVGPNFTASSVPSGTITNETNIIFNGTYEVSSINELIKTISYSKANADISSRAVATSPQATLSNTTSTIYNADNVSITEVTENTISYPKTAANIDESPATGTIYNNTNREIYNGTYTITNILAYNKFSYSTGDDVTKTNLAKNPSMERVGTGTDILRTNHYSNPKMENTTTGWSLLAAGATQTPDVNGTVIDFSDDIAPTSAFFFETTAIPVAVGEWAVASIEITVPPTFPALTLTSTLRSYGVGDAPVQTIEIEPGQTIRLESGVLQTTSTSTGLRHLIGTTDTISAGSRLVVRNAILEKTDRHSSYFDGSTTDALGWNYEWVGTEGASKSVAKAEAIVIRKNEITNPGTETTATGELLRTNLFTNPSFEAALTGWSASAGMAQTRSTDEFHLGGASLRCVSTATNAAVSSGVISVNAGATHTASVWIKGTSGNTVVIGITEYNSSNTEVGTTASNTIYLTGSWQRINVSRNLTSQASTVKVTVTDVKAADAGQTFFLDDTLLEESAFLDDYFSGETPDGDGRSYLWTGTANASTSTVTSSEVYATNLTTNPSMESVASGTDVLRVNLIDNPAPTSGLGLDWVVTNPGDTGVYTQEYTPSGFKATTTSQNNDSTFTVTIGNLTGTTGRVPVSPEKYYALSVTAVSSITDSRSVGIEWYDAAGNYISSAASPKTALTAGIAKRLSVVGMSPVNAATAALTVAKNGVGGPDAALRTLGSTYTVREALFEQSDYAGDYFSGDSASIKGWTYEWTGNANESSSTAKALAVTTRNNILDNPSLETSLAGELLGTNYITNPSMNGVSGTSVMRENLATNPAMETTSGDVAVRENFITNPGMETTGSAITFRTNMTTNPSFESSTGTVDTPLGTKPGVTGVSAATSNVFAWQDSAAALHGTNGVAVQWLKYYGVSTDSGTGIYPFSTSTTPYDLTDTYVDGVYSLHPDNSLTPVPGENGLYTIGF